MKKAMRKARTWSRGMGDMKTRKDVFIYLILVVALIAVLSMSFGVTPPVNYSHVPTFTPTSTLIPTVVVAPYPFYTPTW